MDMMETAAALVDFLGRTCGENCEIVLQDLREGKNCITAIANGHISGRAVGAPLTDLALRLVTREVWKTRDFICNYEGKTMDHRSLHSSTFFLKDGGVLLGMLCVNIDTSKYVQLSEGILRLAGLPPDFPRQMPEPQTENFYENMEEIIRSVLDDSGIGENAARSLSLEGRLAVIERLIDRGVFLLRGSVSSVAEKLKCSEASMYRYIAMINKRKSKSGERAGI